MAIGNILESGVKLPPKVCVLAPGPNGRPYHGRLGGRYTIAVNKAALIETVASDMWMLTHGDQAWYDDAHRRFNGVRVYSDAAWRRRPRDLVADRDYMFTPAETKLAPHRMTSIEGVIRYGATVSGAAVQMAFHLGCEEILLCGVDMDGPGYWDGSANPRADHGPVWDAVSRFDPLIAWLREARGIRLASISPTRLNLPKAEGDTDAAVQSSPASRNAGRQDAAATP